MYRITVIEDDESIRENIVDILEMHSFEVKSYSDGNAALKDIQQELPDLILCDIMMPEIDGYEVLKRLKSDKHLSSVPFVFVTARAEKSDISKGLEFGADAYLIKPFAMDTLIATVNKQIRSSRSAKENNEQNNNNKLSSFSKLLNMKQNPNIRLSQHLIQNISAFDFTSSNQTFQSSSLQALLKSESHYCSDRTIRIPFVEIEEHLSLMFATIAAEYDRATECKINNQLGTQEIYISFPAIVFYTVMEELIENAFKFSPDESPVVVNFSHLPGALKIEIINKGVFSLRPNVAPVQGKNRGRGLGLNITDKLCRFYKSHFAIFQSNEHVVIHLEIPVVQK